MVQNGYIGGTDYYGDIGLGMEAWANCKTIAIKNGVAIGGAGVDYTALASPPDVKSLMGPIEVKSRKEKE